MSAMPTPRALSVKDANAHFVDVLTRMSHFDFTAETVRIGNEQTALRAVNLDSGKRVLHTSKLIIKVPIAPFSNASCGDVSWNFHVDDLSGERLRGDTRCGDVMRAWPSDRFEGAMS
jgi:hypothetical protein